ncbi:MAG TPA: PDDEXK nuclease domain-containing protein [Verrucomicrobiae bacterium]|nr:PDDEXK nuclease domain-containing protein [Verrucomicrobiae bacterium]
MKKSASNKQPAAMELPEGYDAMLSSLTEFLESARRLSARAVNTVMTATYWEVGRRIVEFEQGGKRRAEYGDALLKTLALDLTARFGKGYGAVNLSQMRKFFLTWPEREIFQTLSEKSTNQGFDAAPANIFQTVSEKSDNTFPLLILRKLSSRFCLPWSAYVRLLALRKDDARKFYEAEALRCGWSVRQLDRQISSQFYERTALSRDKAAMLKKSGKREPGDNLSADEEIKDPFVLEFLGLKDEYSESDLEEALIRHLENFLMELGGDFAFISRQRRLRIDDEWYRVDLLFFHRKLRCLVIIDLKLAKLTHADAGQMHMYLNYAREHWTNEGENPPIGLILCAQKGDAIARYALEGLPNKVVAREYLTVLPKEKALAGEIEKVRKRLESGSAG